MGSLITTATAVGRLKEANRVISELVCSRNGKGKEHTHTARYFRAPQGVLTRTMQRVIDSEEMKHVLGDVYCDDWRLACRDSTFVSEHMLRQVQEGSIIIAHMPEKNTDREAIFIILQQILQELNSLGYRVVSLSELNESWPS